MDIVGIGSDIVECVRIGRMIERHGESFLTRVYTAREARFCRQKKHVTEHFASRWAAKQAIVKCLGVGWRRAMYWVDIEVRLDAGGAPKVYISGAAKERAVALGVGDILLTLAHCRAYATATAVAVKSI